MSSPAQSSQSADSTPAPASTPSSTAPVIFGNSSTNASKNLRGLNKPKCIKCGNVARSRCPFQSCKNCCAKAQNPCHIHVLKGGTTIPDKLPSAGSPVVDQQSTEASQSGSSHRATSLRQLSTNFAQFNNLQTPVKSRRPPTRKEAQLINEWRFMKLKEYRDSNIAAENQAFDRYMQNVGLLEEVFAVNAAEDGKIEDGSTEEDTEALVNRLKLQLRSDPARIENTRKRMQYIVDQGMRKLRKLDADDNDTAVSDLDALGRKKKAKSPEAEWVVSFTDLLDKLNKARNEEDLKACWEMKSQLFNKQRRENQVESVDAEVAVEQSSQASVPPTRPSVNSPLKWFSTATIDDEELRRLNAHFDSLEDIEEL